VSAAGAENGEAPKIHLPDPALGRAAPAEAETVTAPEPQAAPEDGAEPPAKPKKKTRRGSRGGRRRRKSGASASGTSSG
jgi:hypothetical protein